MMPMSSTPTPSTPASVPRPGTDSRPARSTGERAWSLGVAALSVAGAASLAWIPSGVLRTHPGVTLMLLLSFAIGGVVADAVWNARPWREVATKTATGVITLFVVIKHLDIFWTHGMDPEFALVPRVIRLVMLVPLFVLSLRSGRRTPRPRPASAD